jgi:hypothetical protein
MVIWRIERSAGEISQATQAVWRDEPRPPSSFVLSVYRAEGGFLRGIALAVLGISPNGEKVLTAGNGFLVHQAGVCLPARDPTKFGYPCFRIFLSQGCPDLPFFQRTHWLPGWRFGSGVPRISAGSP